MTPKFERANRVAALPGVRAGLLVEAVGRAIRALSKRSNGLTRNMHVSYNYVTDSNVHFVLFLNGERQGLFRFNYNSDSFSAPTLRRVPPEGGPPEAPDNKTLALERIFAWELARAQDSIWKTVTPVS